MAQADEHRIVEIRKRGGSRPQSKVGLTSLPRWGAALLRPTVDGVIFSLAAAGAVGYSGACLCLKCGRAPFTSSTRRTANEGLDYDGGYPAGAADALQ